MLKLKNRSMTAIIFICLIQAAAGFNLQDIKETDFLFYQMKDPLLYSDIAYCVNPAVLNRLSSVFFISAFDFACNIASDDFIRLDSSIGEIGGTHTYSTTFLEPDLSLAAFFPAKTKKKNKDIWGVSCDINLDYSNYTNTYVNYNSYTENSNMVQATIPMDFLLEYFYAIRLTKMDMGFSTSYGLNLNPRAFTMVTDNSISPSVTYATDTIHAADEYLHTAKVCIGTIMDISQAAELKLAAAYEGGFNDGAAEFIAIDANGDGRNETIMQYKDYVFYTGTGGPANTAVNFSQTDFTISTIVTLHPTLRLFLAKGMDVFINGNYYLLDLQTNTCWKRLRTIADIDEDLSSKTTTYDASFGTLDILAGTTIEDSKKKTISKMGVGYSRRGVHFSQDGLNRTGLSLYSRYNANHYDELALGTEPVNNALIANNVIPSNTVYQAIVGRAGMEWTPADKTILFASLSVAGSYGTKHYYAYNLDTRTVWSETETSLDIDWDINAVAGISFPLSKTLQCTIDYRGLSTDGGFGLKTETGLFDEELLRTSTNGAIDKKTENGFDVSLGITFVLLL